MNKKFERSRKNSEKKVKSRDKNDAVFLGGGVGSIYFPKSSRVSLVRPSIRIAAVQVSMERKTAGIFSFMNDDIYRMFLKKLAAAIAG